MNLKNFAGLSSEWWLHCL